MTDSTQAIDQRNTNRPAPSSSTKWSITKTSLFKYTENFTTKKRKFSHKISDIFHISAQNIDCGYTLEPPRRGGSNEYLYVFVQK